MFVPYVILSQAVATLITGATAFVYLVYLATMCIVLYARLRGWPSEARPFRLGAWGIPLNVVAIVWTAAVFVNLMVPRTATNPNWSPTAGWSGFPVAYWIIGVPLLVGIVYYVLVHHRRLGVEVPIVPQTGRVR